MESISRRNMNSDNTSGARVTYAQQWPAYNRAQCNEKKLFMMLLNDLCSEIEQPKYDFGRPKLPISDVVFCSVLRVYTAYSGRRFTSDMNFAKRLGFISKVPHYNTIFNYMKRKETALLLKRLISKSAKALEAVETVFAVDSTGFSTSQFDRWFNVRYGRNQDVRKWMKAHVISGVKTNIVASVEVTDGTASDTTQFKYLVADTAKAFQIKEVSADKAYSSRENLQQIRDLGAMPYIPFKINSNPKARGNLFWSKMWHFYELHREEFLEHYHKRSNVETTMHMIKSKFGGRLRSKTKSAQESELLAKVLCHNICVVIQEMFETGFVQDS